MLKRINRPKDAEENAMTWVFDPDDPSSRSDRCLGAMFFHQNHLHSEVFSHEGFHGLIGWHRRVYGESDIRLGAPSAERGNEKIASDKEERMAMTLGGIVFQLSTECQKIIISQL
jgi:hypothetical protein